MTRGFGSRDGEAAIGAGPIGLGSNLQRQQLTFEAISKAATSGRALATRGRAIGAEQVLERADLRKRDRAGFNHWPSNLYMFPRHSHDQPFLSLRRRFGRIGSSAEHSSLGMWRMREECA